MGLRFPDSKKTVGFDRIAETDVPQIDKSPSIVQDAHQGPRAQYEQLALDGQRRLREAERALTQPRRMSPAEGAL